MSKTPNAAAITPSGQGSIRRGFKPAFIMAALFLLIGTGFADNYTLDGQGGVYWDNGNGARISAYPAFATAGINKPLIQFINFSYNNTAPITANMSFVFNPAITSGDMFLWQNTTKTRLGSQIVRDSALKTLITTGFAQLNISPATCSFGDQQNALWYQVNLTNGSLIACFDSVAGQNGQTYTLNYSFNRQGSVTEQYTEEDWVSIGASFTESRFGNYQVWTYNNVPFSNPTLYKTKLAYTVPKNQPSGKYSIYAHAGTPAEVIANIKPVYFVLDPFWSNVSMYQFPYWLHTGYNIPLNEIAVLADVQNGTNFTVYYGGSGNLSDIHATFPICADDFITDASANWQASGGTFFYNETTHMLETKDNNTKRISPTSAYCNRNITNYTVEADAVSYKIENNAFDNIIGVQGYATAVGANDGIAAMFRRDNPPPIFQLQSINQNNWGSVDVNMSRGVPYGLRLVAVNQTFANGSSSYFEGGYKYLNNLTYTNISEPIRGNGAYNSGFFGVYVSSGANNGFTNFRVSNASCNTPALDMGTETAGSYVFNGQTYTKKRVINITSSVTMDNCTFYLNYSYFNDSNMFITNSSISDITLPNITLNSPANITYNSTSVALAYAVADETAISRCWYSLDSGVNTTLASCVNDTFAGLAQGNHTFSIYVNDTSNNVRSTSANFSVDTVKPAVEIQIPLNNSYHINSTFGLFYTRIDVNLGTCWYKLDSGANTTIAGCLNDTLTSVSEGDHNITVFVNDTVDNIGNATSNFTVDTIAPSVSIQSPTNGTYNASSVAFDYSVSDTHLGTCWYSLDSAANTTLAGCANTTFSSLANGDHTLSLYANDTGNLVRTASANFTINVQATGGTDGTGGAGGYYVSCSAYPQDSEDYAACKRCENSKSSTEYLACVAGQPAEGAAPSEAAQAKNPLAEFMSGRFFNLPIAGLVVLLLLLVASGSMKKDGGVSSGGAAALGGALLVMFLYGGTLVG